MGFPWPDSTRAFAEATRWFVAVTGQVGDRWHEPGLGEWTIRDLVGHTSRSLLTVEEYVARPASDVEVASSADYVLETRALAAGPEVAARGVAAGAALGDDPAADVATIADRVLSLIATRDGTELVTTIVGGMRLADYLPTRTFELAVHTCDLCSALDQPLDIPRTAATQAWEIVGELAVSGGLTGALLLAATGRPALPHPFTVL